METNPISDFDPALKPGAGSPTFAWDHPSVVEITRLRYLSDPGFPFWDLSYAYGLLEDGTPVRLKGLPYQVPKRGGLARNLMVECPFITRKVPGGFVRNVLSDLV
jgi:hypothetical protein